MGWKCAPQVMGLVRGEPKAGQKHRANGSKIAKEAGYERASLSDTLDRTRSKLNEYEGYKSGEEFWEAMERDALEYRVRVKGKTKTGEEIIREKGLPHNAVIGWAVIYNPPAEVCAGWTQEQYKKFHSDCQECMSIISPLFRKENIRMTAFHKDEGVLTDKLLSSEYSGHFHDLGIAMNNEGHYEGNKIDAKLLSTINQRFPALMRERGWEMDDLDTTDFARAKEDSDYKAEHDIKRKKSGKAVNQFIRKKMEDSLDKTAEILEQTIALSEKAEAEAIARQRQLEQVAQEQANTQKKLDSRAESQKRVTKQFREAITLLGGSGSQNFKSYSEMADALKDAVTHFIEATTAEAKVKAQEETAAEFQNKEDALDAQRIVLEELSSKMQVIEDADLSRKKYMESVKSKGKSMEEYYQEWLAEKREHADELRRRFAEITTEYDTQRNNITDPQKE